MNKAKERQPPQLSTGQAIHVLGLTVLLAFTARYWHQLGQPHGEVFWLSISIPIAHQVYVWLCWRMELKSGWTSRTIGYSNYLNIFFIFLICRVVSLVWLGIADGGSMPIFGRLSYLFTLVLGWPAIYTLQSVRDHFGLERAAGADHFKPHYRDLPLVSSGAFRWNRNAMYTFGFLGTWALAFLFRSQAGLLAAAFHHAYIWVHYYATEKPDFKFLYPDSDPTTNQSA